MVWGQCELAMGEIHCTCFLTECCVRKILPTVAFRYQNRELGEVFFKCQYTEW